MWEYASPIGTDSCYKLSPEFQLFYITEHAANHLQMRGGMGIRPLLDIWLLRTRTTYDEVQVEEFMRNTGLLKFYQTCCHLIDVWFSEKSPNNLTDKFETLVLSGGVMGSEQSTLIARRRGEKKASYIFKRVFSTRKEIKTLFPVCVKYPFLVPIFRFVRWTHILSPTKRKRIRREISSLNSHDQSELNSFDGLLREMEL